MKSNNRDDFSSMTKKALANRAGHQCSFTGCNCPTSGPSEESDEAIISIGIAAHIHAAAPGGKRYLPSMKKEERIHISNGIWLCSNHSIEIDRDDKQYTAELLKGMKLARERQAALELRSNEKKTNSFELFELGPDTIGIGEVITATNLFWKIKVEHFVKGDIYSITSFIDTFSSLDSYDRYVISNELGDGRSLSASPEWEKSDGKYIITCFIENAYHRVPAEKLGLDIALNDDHDIFFENGSLAMVSGLKALPQKIKMCLSINKTENPFHYRFGSRFNKLYEIYKDTFWLNGLFKLDVIRLAAIPYSDKTSQEIPYLPLKCVKRVNSIHLVEIEKNGNWIPVDFDLEVEGIGNWTRRIPIFIAFNESDEIIE